MGEYTPPKTNGRFPTQGTTSANVTGGQVLYASGDGTVAPTSGVLATVVGVAAHDAASGKQVGIWPIAGLVHLLSCPAGVAAGAGVESGAAGIVAPAATSIAASAAAGSLLGIARKTVAADAAAKAEFFGRH